MVLKPFRKQISGIAVESTYNWYWLVDSLMDKGYKMHLANPSAIRPYEGLKHTDDKWDSFLLTIDFMDHQYVLVLSFAKK